MKNVPDSTQSAEFDGYVKKWQRILNLQDWRIERSSGAAKAMAEVLIEYPDRLATYKLGSFGSAQITPQTLEGTALHEVLHVLMADLVKGKLKGDALVSAEHRIVNTLEKLLMSGEHGGT